jgi:stage II sporulation protein D
MRTKGHKPRDTRNETEYTKCFSVSVCSVPFRLFRYCFLAIAVLCAACSDRPTQSPANGSLPAAPAADGLTRVATEALGEREGTILVIDPQTGLLRAVVNPRLASGQAYPPGSAIKPFTALAALRSGILNPSTHHLCGRRYVREDFSIECSHRRSTVPFDLRRALAYSCNDYFARAGARLSASAFESTLASFGFGERTGVDWADEIPGRLPDGELTEKTALGDGDELLVTPVQMIAAYAALVNGGRIYRPHSNEDSQPEPVRTLAISEQHRAAILGGMSGVVEYGTASSAGPWPVASMRDNAWSVFGKTGTSTSSNGFRTQGWFVAFLGEGSNPRPEQIRAGVVVFLKRSQGAVAARVARPIIEALINAQNHPAVSNAVRSTEGGFVRVRSVGGNLILEMTMDEYLRGVVTAEAGTETEIEALKALAVVARGYALFNGGRHAGEGYDYCSTTHCQRYVDGSVRDAVRAAVEQTRGTVLTDDENNPVESYFHASCGGGTSDTEAVWGTASSNIVRGIRDEYCTASGARRWLDRISAKDLARALETDPRTDAGARVEGIEVTERDASGRVKWLTIEGAKRRRMRGWDFKMIVGRALGWHLIKSTKFEVVRAGAEFHFRGSGFGHGLGLCQDGSHTAARRGADFKQILVHYFPAARIANIDRIEHAGLKNVVYRTQARTRTGNRHFQITTSRSGADFDVELMLKTLDEAREDIIRRVRAAGLSWKDNGRITVHVHASTADYIADTGLPGYTAAATRGDRIALQPIDVLKRRGVLMETLRHEYAHAVIDVVSGGRAPRWLAEGLAIHFAGEGPRFRSAMARARLPVDEIERRLARVSSSEEMQVLYAACWSAVKELIERDGEASVWRRVSFGREER